jgi:hypothetical protein
MNILLSRDIAMKYGFEEAIMIDYLRATLAKEYTKKKKYIDGRVWVNLPCYLIEVNLSFWKESKIRQVLKSLERQKVILKKKMPCFGPGNSFAFVKQNEFM